MANIDTRLAIIIPTKGRPGDLRLLLNSIRLQEIWPAQVIIIDSGSFSLDEIIADFKFFDISYRKHQPSSLPIQRNIGVKLLKKDIKIVAFFDDDAFLCPNTIDLVMKFWSNSSDEIAGVACNNISHPRHKVSFIEKLFLLGDDRVGIVLPSGFQSKLCSLDRDYQVQWLIGGATFWKREIFNSYKFDEWFYGYAHCEDLNFSYQISKRYKLVALKNAKFIHNIKPIEAKYEYHLGKMQVINRIYFVKKHCEFSQVLCYWSCTGLFLKNLFLGTVGCKPRYLLRGIGVLTGLFMSFFKLERIKERIKS